MRTPDALSLSSKRIEQIMQKRRRFKHTTTLEERLAKEAKQLREEAGLLPPGPVRDGLLRRARQDETASHMTEWLNSRGLQPPRG
ncbi:hypothetical protein [Bradyrhizobium paxllaeri]|uniref:hypothetical protein n=1 Tax=Bradyrhizobium paxllaeri TaxID=190148 RepID=UPI003221FAFB